MPSVIKNKNRKVGRRGNEVLSSTNLKSRRNRKTPFKNKICQPLIIKKIQVHPVNPPFLQPNPSYGFSKYRGTAHMQRPEPISSFKYAHSMFNLQIHFKHH